MENRSIEDENENIIKGSEVIKYLVHKIPAVEKFSWLIEKESSQKAMDVFYDKVNEVRKKIKKSKGCTDCGKRRSAKGQCK